MATYTEQKHGPARRRRAYDALLLRAHVEHTTIEAICDATGLSRSTVQRWRRDPANMAEVESARGDVVRDALAQLRNGLGVAAERLVRVARDSERDDVAVRAAVAMFEAHGKLSERTDLEQRLAELEARLAVMTPGPAVAVRWPQTSFLGGAVAASTPNTPAA